MNLRLLLPSVVAIAAVPAHAQEATPDVMAGIGQMVFGLAVVVVMLLGSLWLIKRLSVPRGAAAGLKVLGGVSIGSRERVVLVEVADKVLVVGVSPASVTTLHTLDAAALRHAAPAPTAPPAGGEFASWLKASIAQRRDTR